MKRNGIAKRETCAVKTKKKKNRVLVSVNVLGSAGPLRFLVDEDDEVSGVIDSTLRAYAREGRFPVLGLDADNFLLYSTNAGFNGEDRFNRRERFLAVQERERVAGKRRKKRDEWSEKPWMEISASQVLQLQDLIT